ncbi:MAG: transglycosylase SLT domain-containing protein [Burkholderiaceae bacterium]|nr:transglycosylase SLT domain-containing protein [Burkholderiaceae bacterium]
MRNSIGSRVRQGIDWLEAAADLAGNGLGMLRRLSEAVGALVVVSAVTIATMPTLRDSTVGFVRGWFVPEAQAARLRSLSQPDTDEAVAATAHEALTGTVRWVHLEPAEASVAQYLSRRYHVADEAVRPLVLAAREAGRESQLDPLLILAVMAVESSLNPFAESPVGAQGLMQVMTSVHSTRFELDGDQFTALEPVANIRVGSAILSDSIRRGGSVERGLQLYVGAGNLQGDGGYAGRVMAEMARLKMAAAGNVTAALASGATGARADSRAVGNAQSAPANAVASSS